MNINTKKILAKEFLILSSTIGVTIVVPVFIIFWNSIVGQIDIYYSDKASSMYYSHEEFEISDNRYWYGFKIYQNLIDGGYEVPSDNHVFIKDINKVSDENMKIFYNTLIRENYIEETFDLFLTLFPTDQDLVLRNELYYKYNNLKAKSDEYYKMKLKYKDAKTLVFYSIMIWLIIIYPLRGFIIMFKWSSRILKS